MKRLKRAAAALMAMAMVVGMASCGSTGGKKGEQETKKIVNDKGEEVEVKVFSAFFAVPGNKVDEGNVVQDKIAEKIGAKCEMEWLVGQTAEEAIGVMIAGGEYPDFVDASSGMKSMVDAGAFIPIDEYWDDFPNIKNFYTEAEWNSIRADDGHVYIIPQFGKTWEKDTTCVHNDEAFWIQTRVLKWANYPKIETLDEYFDLIERYVEANPTMPDGTPNIGYEILCDDWRYFCLENAPFFLDGYPNDGCCIVDRNTHEAIDYNTTDTAKRYFQKLNEEYKKGIVDPETFTMKYDAYISKLSTGRVCGMVDQHWDFNDAELAIKAAGLDDCTYVPVGITMDKGVEEHWHAKPALDVSNGVGITVSCKEPKAALKFMNDLLDPEILTLRNWGIEGVNYNKGEDGVFTRTEEMRTNANDQAYINANLCPYAYFPNYSNGMDHDGINGCDANHQATEFYESLSADVKECFDAYGVKTYVEMLNEAPENEAWYPMWSYSNALTTDTPEGLVWAEMANVKHEYLPQVCIADDFDKAWDEYLTEYKKKCDVDGTLLPAFNKEIQRRIDVAAGK
ncbi:extracellular solute-binding protein [Ruminococcus albus]|uniref:extracellular solute-binding protein n=1 Tax=Ruminococcus albus TaxID=1264 RepID=UPI00046443E2|nr:extracellular solute-binding protein [Ruminococcus albus]